ncbi:MAG TPA: hypothetical protein VLE53_03685 [Gemmatimonadaceae bacterium]|nr:hypothetical protein [Gemmatimonadaceae bacterium]
MSLNHFRLVLAALAAVMLGACVDSPSAPASPALENTLAVNFDALADEQTAAGDVERAEELRWAALAIRLGVRPTVFHVTNAGVNEEYNAFVHAARWAQATDALRPVSHRSLVAWRRTDELLQVILVSLRSDSAPVLHPYSLRLSGPETDTSPVLGARAAYFERSPQGSAWLGVGGWAKIAPKSVGGVCTPPVTQSVSAPDGVTCQLARYAVEFQIEFAQTRSYSSRLMDPSPPTRRITAAEQDVAGVLLTFYCAQPLSDRGC